MATTKLRSVLLIVSGCLLVVPSGCATREPFRLDSAFGKNSRPDVKDPKLANALKAIEQAKQKPSGKKQFAIDTTRRTNEMIERAQQARGQKQSFGNKLKNAAGSTASYVGEAFRVSPNTGVGPTANNPVSLAHNPGPLNADLFVKSAAHLEAQGDITAAFEQYQKALTTDATYKPALLGLGRLLHRQGQMQEAISTYQRALAAHPRDPVLLNDLGLCYARAKDYDQAIGSMQLALNANPSSDLYRNNLAAIFVESERYNDAVNVLAKVHGPAIANYNVGYLLNQRARPAEAHEFFLKALSFDPNMAQAQTMLSRTAPVNRTPHNSVEQRSPQMHAQRPMDNDFSSSSTLAPVVLPHQVPASEQQMTQQQVAPPTEYSPSPFNYQTAAKSFRRADPAVLAHANNFAVNSNATNGPAIPQLLPSVDSTEADDPMMQVLGSMKQAGDAMTDSNVSAASYVEAVPTTELGSNAVPVAQPTAEATEISIRMPSSNSRIPGTLVPPTPIEF